MAGSLLKTRNVFLDTGAYDHQKFRFDHAALRKLRELGRIGYLRILVTAAVDGEVRRHIGSNLENAALALRRFQSHAAILEIGPPEELQPLFRVPDVARMRESALAVWESFLNDAKVEKVDAATVNVPELLMLYFSQKAPFGEKKKSEFPDAISLLSLAHWCMTNTAQLYLIGDDPDLQAWCAERPDMFHAKSLSEFLNLYNRAEEKLTQLALEIFEREKEWILSTVEEAFVECTFTYAENWEADVENVKITAMEVDDVDVIEVDEHRVILALDTNIRFRARVSGPDYDRGWSGHFEGSYSERLNVSLEIKYDLAKEEATEILDVLFNDGKDIKVRDPHGLDY